MHQLAIFTIAAVSTPDPATTGPRTVAPPAGAETSVAPAATATGPGTTSAPGSQPAPNNPGGLPGGMLLPIILMFVALYFVLFRGQRKDEKRRKEMIAELKKGDRVMTIGGMLAKVVSVDGDEIVLKVDEAANVKATYRRSAIQEVIVDKEEKK
jgi:preprotein translocase subunit YajC